MLLSTYQKTFSEFFSAFPIATSNFEDFGKKEEPERLLVSEIIHWKSGLLKCLKTPASEHLHAVNMLKAPEHCLNMHSKIFVIFFDDFERNQFEKFLLLVFEILSLFVNILTPNEKYSLSVKPSV